MNGAEMIAAERKRQIDEEGRLEAHDDMLDDGELCLAAICYAAPRPVFVSDLRKGRHLYRDPWPFEPHWWKPTPDDRIRELVKAGALIAAEIDRLQRAKKGARRG